MEIDRRTLEVLLERASREAPRTGEEKRAEQEVRVALARDYEALFPVTPDGQGGYTQAHLFDPTPYDEV